MYKFLSRQHHKDNYHKETCTHKIDTKNRTWYPKWSHAIYQWDFAFKAWPKAQFILLHIEELQPQTCQRHRKYQQGKEDSWDVLRKATSITNKYTKRKN